LPNKEATSTFTNFKFQYVIRHDPIEHGTLISYTLCC